MFHNIFDSHTHSDNSLDGFHSVMYLAEQAEAMGLMGVAITDHVECLDYREKNYGARIIQSAVDTAKANAAFRYKMTIVLGVELGVMPDMYRLADSVVSLYPYDFILGSCHYSRDREEYIEIDYAAISQTGRHLLLKDYFEDILELTRWGKFDCLAHLTYPLRCAMRNNRIKLSIKPYRDIIDEILRALVAGEKALEINTSGLRGDLMDTMPPKWVLNRYRELGGELVTIGSDAHRVDLLGAGISDAMELLVGLGYQYFAFYRSRKPVMLRIV